MASRVIRSRLVYPVAAILAAGLVYAPAQPAATVSPRLAEVSALRLQAEVTSLVTGMAGAVGAGQPAAAASTLTGTAPTAATTCTYPCTFFDKLLSKLPEDIRYAILPTLYVVASVLGLLLAPVTLVTSALFGWPAPLWPAAAAAPETSARKASPAPAEATPVQSDPIRAHADPVVSPSGPAQSAVTGTATVVTASTSDDHRRRPGQRAVSPEAVAVGAPAAADIAPADTRADVIAPEIEAAAADLAGVGEATDDVTSAVSAARRPKAPSATAAAEAAPQSPRATTRSAR